MWPRGWVEIELYSSMTSALKVVSDQQHAQASLYPQERPGTHCTGCWVGPRTGLDRRGKSRPLPARDSIPRRSSPYSVAIPTELPGPHEHHLQRPNANLYCFQNYLLFWHKNCQHSTTQCDKPQEWQGRIQSKLRKITTYTLLLLCRWSFYVWRWFISMCL
jgi:hypothetical protein